MVGDLAIITSIWVGAPCEDVRPGGSTVSRHKAAVRRGNARTKGVHIVKSEGEPTRPRNLSGRTLINLPLHVGAIHVGVLPNPMAPACIEAVTLGGALVDIGFFRVAVVSVTRLVNRGEINAGVSHASGGPRHGRAETKGTVAVGLIGPDAKRNGWRICEGVRSEPVNLAGS